MDCYRESFLKSRINARLIRVPCDTYSSYKDYLCNNPEECQKFKNSFTINYSTFFRNPEIFMKFQDLILKSLNLDKEYVPNVTYDFLKLLKKEKISKASKRGGLVSQKDVMSRLGELSLYKKINNPTKSRDSLRIWSCACATGEEPYSIAMILENLKNSVPEFPKYEIIASDIDQIALSKANKGQYYEDKMKEVPDIFKENYFKQKKTYFGHEYSISKKIINQVKFIKEDITKGHEKLQKYDVIFCRNILIYINKAFREQFIKVLEDSMVYGGLLILGKTELLHNSKSAFKKIDSHHNMYLKNHK